MTHDKLEAICQQLLLEQGDTPENQRHIELLRQFCDELKATELFPLCRSLPAKDNKIYFGLSFHFTIHHRSCWLAVYLASQGSKYLSEEKLCLWVAFKVGGNTEQAANQALPPPEEELCITTDPVVAAAFFERIASRRDR